MRKVTAIFLLFLFLIANSGMAVSIHYCGGSFASIDFFSGEKHNCPCGEKPMKDNCCEDHATVLKASNEVENTNHYILKTQLPKFEFATFTKPFTETSLILDYTISDFYHPPPFKPKNPIYLLDKVFLI